MATSQAGLYGLDPTSDNGLAAAERALELNPGLADAMAAKARVLAGMGRFDEALPLHQRSFELDPDSYDVLFLYGRTLFQLGRHEDAITYWERATELFPDAIPAVTSVEMCYTATGQTEKAKGAVLRAIERLERALARDANDTYALMYKALGHAHMGEVDAAKMLALRLKAMEPEDPSIDYNIGCALAIMGEIEDALDLLERDLLELDGDDLGCLITSLGKVSASPGISKAIQRLVDHLGVRDLNEFNAQAVELLLTSLEAASHIVQDDEVEEEEESEELVE